MHENTRICAVDPVIIKDDKVLLIKRSFGVFRGYWVLPGGRMEKGEDARTCCIREAKEETGLDVEVLDFIGFYDSPERDPEKHAVSLAFLCRPAGGEMKHNEEATDIKFFSRDSLPENIGWDHKDIIEDAFRMLSRTRS